MIRNDKTPLGIGILIPFNYTDEALKDRKNICAYVYIYIILKTVFHDKQLMIPLKTLVLVFVQVSKTIQRYERLID